MIHHFFTDSLRNFVSVNQCDDAEEWLETLPVSGLIQLGGMLSQVLKGGILISDDELADVNWITDVHLLAFEMASIGKKRRVRTMDEARRMKLLRSLHEMVRQEKSRRY